jgi:hypothetical protein
MEPIHPVEHHNRDKEQGKDRMIDITTGWHALRLAMAYRAAMGDKGPGAAQAVLRKAIMQAKTPWTSPTADECDANFARLMAYTIADMPPPVDDLSLLIDVIAMRHGYTARADAWRHIGINPNRGRSLLGQNAGAIDWPIWFCARQAAIGN